MGKGKLNPSCNLLVDESENRSISMSSKRIHTSRRTIEPNSRIGSRLEEGRCSCPRSPCPKSPSMIGVDRSRELRCLCGRVCVFIHATRSHVVDWPYRPPYEPATGELTSQIWAVTKRNDVSTPSQITRRAHVRIWEYADHQKLKSTTSLHQSFPKGIDQNNRYQTHHHG
jgi:hypothetical protein